MGTMIELAGAHGLLPFPHKIIETPSGRLFVSCGRCGCWTQRARGRCTCDELCHRDDGVESEEPRSDRYNPVTQAFYQNVRDESRLVVVRARQTQRPGTLERSATYRLAKSQIPA